MAAGEVYYMVVICIDQPGLRIWAGPTPGCLNVGCLGRIANFRMLGPGLPLLILFLINMPI